MFKRSPTTQQQLSREQRRFAEEHEATPGMHAGERRQLVYFYRHEHSSTHRWLVDPDGASWTSSRCAERRARELSWRSWRPGASGERGAGGTARAAPRPRHRRARPAAAGGRARPRAASARGDSARAAAARGSPGYHWYTVPRVGHPDPQTFAAAFRALAAFHDELWSAPGSPRAHDPRRVLDGRGDELRARARARAAVRSRGYSPSRASFPRSAAGSRASRTARTRAPLSPMAPRIR